MRHITSVEERAQRLLRHMMDEADQRDRLLGEVAALIHDDGVLLQSLQAIEELRSHALPMYVGRCAALAHSVEASSVLAGKSSQRVRRLDHLLQRTEAAHHIVQSIMCMEKDLARLPAAVEARTVEDIVELLRSYEAARGVVVRDEAVGGASEVPAVVASARAVVRQAAEALFAGPAAAPAAIQQGTRLLVALGEAAEGQRRYMAWVTDQTTAALKSAVRRGLEAMADPAATTTSHLSLVSHLLDTVVAAWEGEETFMRTCWGPAARPALLAELHARATVPCVPVLKDFVARRQDVLRAAASGKDRPAREPAMSTARASAPDGAAPVDIAATRRMDQTLEEMSHLVSCCQVYLSFVEAQLGTPPDAATPAGPPSLVHVVQDILSLYVPLQNRYFEVAYRQAAALQTAAARSHRGEAARPVSRPSGHGSPTPPPSKSVAGAHAAFMHRLSQWYKSATRENASAGPAGKAAGATADDAEAGDDDDGGGPLTLVDDVFFFLRIALHRAWNARSTQIASAVGMSCMDVLQCRLLPHLRAMLSLQRSEFVPPRALRWAGVAQKAAVYTTKLAEELRRLSDTRAGSSDQTRFREQAHDLEAIAREMGAMVERGVERYAQVCVQGVMPPHLERLAGLPYVLREEVYYRYEVEDPWVQACVADWSATFDYVEDLLDPVLFDPWLFAVAQEVAQSVYTVGVLPKRVNAVGALQMDKEVRALRALFLQRTHGASLRNPFAKLHLAVTLWLCDRPRDAMEEARNEALTGEEKKQVLLCRVDFAKEEVLALRLP